MSRRADVCGRCGAEASTAALGFLIAAVTVTALAVVVARTTTSPGHDPASDIVAVEPRLTSPRAESTTRPAACIQGELRIDCVTRVVSLETSVVSAITPGTDRGFVGTQHGHVIAVGPDGVAWDRDVEVGPIRQMTLQEDRLSVVGTAGLAGVDAATGRRLWRLDSLPLGDRVVAPDVRWSHQRRLQGIDPLLGRAQWEVEVEPWTHVGVLGNVVVIQGSASAPGERPEATTVLDRDTGQLRFTVPGRWLAPSGDPDRILVQTPSRLAAWSLQGEPLWSTRSADTWDAWAGGGSLVRVVGDPEQGELVAQALDDGAVRWSRPLPHHVSARLLPAGDDDLAVMVDADDSLVVVRVTDGAVRWRRQGLRATSIHELASGDLAIAREGAVALVTADGEDLATVTSVGVGVVLTAPGDGADLVVADDTRLRWIAVP